MAKYFKVPVREFSIGMGPRLISKVINNTRYSLKALPFGGSCAMIGEDAAGSGDFTKEEGVVIDDNGLVDFDGVKFTKEELEENNFSVISPVKKFFICLLGPFMNFTLAFLLAMILVSKVGFDIPIISTITEGGAAQNASPYALMPNDEVIELEIPGEKQKVISYRDLALFMQLNNNSIMEYKYPLAITFKRNDETLRTITFPTYDEEYQKVMIGISFGDIYKKPNGIIDTIKYAGLETYFYIKTTVTSLRMLIRGKLSANEISGPVGTVKVMGDAIKESSSINLDSAIYTILSLIVLISSNLGVMNLLPIPALDGGRIVFAAIEMIIGRPINKEFEAAANTITMILLLVFMIWIFGMDISKIIMK